MTWHDMTWLTWRAEFCWSGSSPGPGGWGRWLGSWRRLAWSGGPEWRIDQSDDSFDSIDQWGVRILIPGGQEWRGTWLRTRGQRGPGPGWASTEHSLVRGLLTFILCGTLFLTCILATGAFCLSITWLKLLPIKILPDVRTLLLVLSRLNTQGHSTRWLSSQMRGPAGIWSESDIEVC